VTQRQNNGHDTLQARFHTHNEQLLFTYVEQLKTSLVARLAIRSYEVRAD